MSIPVDEITELTELISTQYCPDAGYSTRILYQESEGSKVAHLMVMKYSPEKRLGDEDETRSVGDYVLVKGWSPLKEGNKAIEDADKAKFFVILGEFYKLPTFQPAPFAWEQGSHAVRSMDGDYYFGIDRPGHSYKLVSGHSISLDEKTLRTYGYQSARDFVWDELVSSGPERPRNICDYARLGVVVLIPHWWAWLRKIELQDGSAEVTVESKLANINWQDFRLSYIAYSHSDRISSPKECSVDSSGVTRIDGLMTDVSSVEMTLNFLPPGCPEPIWVDTRLQEKTRSDVNARLSAHQYLDPGSSTLEKNLLDPERDADRFEWAVSILFHLMGYRVEHWGTKFVKKKGNPNEIDVLAFDENTMTVLAIECTTADGEIPRKAELVARRANDLNTILSEWSVFPVVFVPVKSEQGGSSVHKTSLSGQVRVISRDGIITILEKVRAGAPLKKISDELLMTYVDSQL